MRLSANVDLKNERRQFELPRLIRVHVKPEERRLEWTMDDRSRSTGDANRSNLHCFYD